MNILYHCLKNFFLLVKIVPNNLNAQKILENKIVNRGKPGGKVRKQTNSINYQFVASQHDQVLLFI